MRRLTFLIAASAATVAAEPAPKTPSATFVEIAARERSGCVVHASGRAACWGRVGDRYLDAPEWLPGLADVRDIALREDGTMFALQRNGSVVRIVAVAKVEPVAKLAHVAQLGLGSDTMYARLDNGTITEVQDDAPVPVRGVKGAVDLAVGASHACVALDTGGVACWGQNSHGELGVDKKVAPDEVVAVPRITDAIAVAVGDVHSCVLHKTGKVSCWGATFALGDPKLKEREDTIARGQVFVVPGVEHATQLRATSEATCAVTASGEARCWGNNRDGQLGNGTLDTDASATRVKLAGIAKIAPGACALTTAGALHCWAHRVHYRATAVPGLDHVVSVAAGSKHTCAVQASGKVWCWGKRDIVANGTLTDRSDTKPTAMTVDDAIAIVAGAPSSHMSDACVVRRSGAVGCWSDSGSTAPGVTDATAIALGQNHGCVVRRSGGVACWGNNEQFNLGRPAKDFDLKAGDVAGLHDMTAVAAGRDTACALATNGTVTCWGDGTSGLLGTGNMAKHTSPLATVAGITDAVEVTVGFTEACARLKRGDVRCWGTNWSFNAVKDPNLYHAKPVAVGITDAVSVAAGRDFVCVARTSGSVTCFGELHDVNAGGASPNSKALDIPGVTDAVRVTVGDDHACALTRRGTVACWGENDRGQLGDGTGVGHPMPVPLPAP